MKNHTQKGTIVSTPIQKSPHGDKPGNTPNATNDQEHDTQRHPHHLQNLTDIIKPT